MDVADEARSRAHLEDIVKQRRGPAEGARAARTASSPSAPATWGAARSRSTTSRRGCRAARATARRTRRACSSTSRRAGSTCATATRRARCASATRSTTPWWRRRAILIAILENHQHADGSIAVPKALRALPRRPHRAPPEGALSAGHRGTTLSENDGGAGGRRPRAPGIELRQGLRGPLRLLPVRRRRLDDVVGGVRDGRRDPTSGPRTCPCPRRGSCRRSRTSTGPAGGSRGRPRRSRPSRSGPRASWAACPWRRGTCGSPRRSRTPAGRPCRARCASLSPPVSGWTSTYARGSRAHPSPHERAGRHADHRQGEDHADRGCGSRCGATCRRRPRTCPCCGSTGRMERAAGSWAQSRRTGTPRTFGFATVWRAGTPVS